jgi:uncharacterized protein (TIGR03437 family)
MVQAGGTSYLLAQADGAGSAYVVSGALLARYQDLGGPAGALGYPVSAQSAGGTQLFANRAGLAGNPVQLVSGAILAKWAALGYETGPAGAPSGEAAVFTTFAASSGTGQSFAGGSIYAAAAGPHAGQAWFVSGPILDAFVGAGGPAGALGMPVTDQFSSAGIQQQNFEGGNIAYTPGTGAAKINSAPRTPTIIAAPAAVTAGGSAQIAIYGFADNATLNVSITGQPNFSVKTSNGAYTWSMVVPLSAASGQIAIHAAGGASSGTGAAAADGVLTIQGFNNHRVPLVKAQGDNQTGPPGAALPLPLVVLLADAAGNPVVGAPVTFEASPGAQISAAAALTDAQGRASVYLRLPPAAGVALVTVNAPAVAQAPVTFGALVKAQSLTNFPPLRQSGNTPLGQGPATIGQKGALLTAVASILQYGQNRGAMASPNGTASLDALNQFLTSYCTADTAANRICDGYLAGPTGERIVNLWRAAEFTGGVDVQVLSPDVATVADWVAQGEPLLLALGLTRNGAAAGGNFVVATGIASDGSIQIADPNPLLARASLSDYLNGFTAGGASWQGALAGVARFAAVAPGARRFLVGALSQPTASIQNFALAITSAGGTCGLSIALPDAVDSSGNPAPFVSRFQVCDGAVAAYQVDIGAAQQYRAFVADLVAGGSSFDISGNALASYAATRPQLNLVLAPQSTSILAGGVVNAATFTPGIAPGGLFTIFGSGLSGAAVDFDGTPAAVLAAFPFQVNAQVPVSVAPGTHTLSVKSTFGSAQQMVTISAVSPAIFLVGNPPSGAVENQDGTLNLTSNPLPRGQVLIVYCTGLGPVTGSNNGLFTTNSTITVNLSGTELPVAFAGLTPGFTGLYQVNVPIPPGTPPASGLSLKIDGLGQSSNSVQVAIQ